ncbi:MAG: 2OG-Fe(II) oxygenase [Gammaproteobacteria bacterium]|nr:2OG-Fe(II) oxygenase [Gammaproteobacteria bacterium]MDE0367519.1 2OG-Fe(II) oxygenase [Gammaproteobacteria bacterium]
MTGIDIEYAVDWRQLEDLFQSVERPGGFCTHGREFAAMPTVEVAGVGMLSFPVPVAQIRSLVAAAERAPYGKGADTLVDTSVRDCWQIGADRIRLGGRGWASTSEHTLNAAAAGLGCPADRLDARLYKLLLYETGGFFAAHRDTEKADGMVATLSVTLPAAGAGGELVVRHRAEEAVIDMNATEPSELAYAAFYADCTHETRPVLDGYRLSLVFNLCLKPGDTETPRQAPDYSSTVQGIAEQLIAWREGEHGPDKLVWMLEHDYSQAGLSFDSLKNADGALARVLERSTNDAKCEFYAAIVHVEEQGTARYADGEYFDGWGWRGDDADDLEFDEILDGRYWLDGWVGSDGEEAPFGKIALNPGEALPAGALDHAEPDEQWVNEATGNEGVTLERAYRHAAFVIWPRCRTLDLLADESIDAAIAWAQRQIAADPALADGLIERLIEFWPPTSPRREDKSRTAMLRLLEQAGDAMLAMRFLREIVARLYDGSESEALHSLLEFVGPADAAPFLADLAGNRFEFRPRETLQLLLHAGDLNGFDWRQTLADSARAVLAALPTALRSVRGGNIVSWPPADSRGKMNAGALRDLFLLAWRCGLTDAAQRAAETVAEYPAAIEPERTVPQALAGLRREQGLSTGGAYAN